MQADNPLKEGAGNRCGGVGVAEVDEVCILGEAVNDGEDDGFLVDLGQAFDEVHRDVGLHLGRHVKGQRRPASCKDAVLLCWQVLQARTSHAPGCDR